MPRSKTTPKRAAKARRYGRQDAHYQRVLDWWAADRALAPKAHPARDKPRKPGGAVGPGVCLNKYGRA